MILTRIRILPFYLSLITWVTLSSPTPGSLGVPEIIIFTMILIFILINFELITLTKNQQFFLLIQCFILPIMAITSALSSDAGLNIARKILRDFIPFYFLPAGVICGIILTKIKSDFRLLLLALLFCSMILAIRHFEENGFRIKDIGIQTFTTVGNYFLVEQVFLTGGLLAISKFFNTKDPFIQKLPWSLCCCAAILFIAASLSQVLRGHFFIIIFLLGYVFYIRSIYTVIFLLPIITMLLFLVSDDYFALLIEKMISVGDNNRISELTSIFAHISMEFKTLLFGKGFGGFHQTQTGGTGMFAHNFVAYNLLKIGIIGTVLYTFSVWLLFYHNLKNIIITQKLTSVLIITLSILYYVLIQPGFKSIGFIYTIAIVYSSFAATRPRNRI